MILGGGSKNVIPLPLGAASLLLATQHTYLKNPYFFWFLGNLGCLVRIGFYNGLWRGRQCVGVVTRSRAYLYSMQSIDFLVPKIGGTDHIWHNSLQGNTYIYIGFISGIMYTADWVMFLRYLGDLCYRNRKNPFICTSHSKKVNHFTALGGQDKISDENGGGLQKHIWQGFLSCCAVENTGNRLGKPTFVSKNFMVTFWYLKHDGGYRLKISFLLGSGWFSGSSR